MPQRFLKPGIVSSPKWDGMSWQAQSFYIRIITLVDDFGRYDAHPMLLRSHAFPLRDDIKPQQVAALCGEVAKAGLVVFYRKDDKDYLQITNWTERARSDHSKYPPHDNTCQQSAAESCGILPPKSSSSSSSSSSPSVASQPSEYPPEFMEFWKAYPKKIGKGEACKSWQRLKPPLPEVLGAVARQSKSRDWIKDGGQFVPNPATYLNQRRWEDEGLTPVSRTSGPDLSAKAMQDKLNFIKTCQAEGRPIPPELAHLVGKEGA